MSEAMNKTEQINAKLQTLPPSLQQVALEFIEFLAAKTARREALDEDAEWSDSALTQAMRGLEDEDSPAYTEADLKERWR
jgi:hypothetical protein